MESVREEIAKQERLLKVASAKWAKMTEEGDDDQAAIFEGQMGIASAKLKSHREREATIRARMASGEKLEVAMAAFEAALDAAGEAFDRDEITFDERRAILEGLRVKVMANGRDAKVRLFVNADSSF